MRPEQLSKCGRPNIQERCESYLPKRYSHQLAAALDGSKANQSGFGSFCDVPVHHLVQLSSLQTCVNGATLMYSNRSKACALEGERGKWSLWAVKLRALLQWGVVFCPAVVNCRCTLYFSFCLQSTLRQLQKAIYCLLMLQTGHVCYILDSSGFRASNTLICCWWSLRQQNPALTHHYRLSCLLKKKILKKDGCSHNARGKNQRQKQKSHW